MKKIRIFVFLLLIVSLGSVYAELTLSHTQGLYSRNIILSITNDEEKSIFYKFLASSDSNYVEYNSPLYLSAADGEYRSFTISISKKDKNNFIPVTTLKYIIDKSIPLMPEVNIKGGVYNRDISLKFLSFNGGNSRGNDKYKTFYKLTGNSTGPYKKWDGSSLIIRQTDALQNISLVAYNQNLTGLKSPLVLENYVILPKLPGKKTLDIFSPVSGTFANSQLLYIDTTGFKWVRYSLGSNDPAKYGTTYHSPVLFKSKGEYILNVAGLLLNSTKIIRKTLKFTIENVENPLNDTPDGVYTGNITIKLNRLGVLYSLGSSTNQNVPVIKYEAPIKLFSIPGVRKFVTLYVYDKGKKYRYFYVLDNRIPGVPIINSTLDNKTKKMNIEILAEANSEVRYTTDGSTPDRFSPKYSGPFSIEVTSFNGTGSVIVKATAFLDNKLQSKVTSKLANFDFQPPEKPSGKIVKIDNNTYKLIVTNIENNSLYYTVNYEGKKIYEFDRDIFSGTEENTFSFPAGFTGNVTIKTTLRDNSGNISEPAYFSFHVDTQAPLSPNLILNELGIILTPVSDYKDSKIYYTFLGNSKEVFNSLKNFKQFNSPLELEKIENNTYLTFYSVDEYGNKSPVVIKDITSLNDSKYLSNIKFSGVENGGVYKDNRELTFFHDSKVELYYSISSDGTEPVVPVLSEENKINGTLSFNCGEKEEKSYYLKILAVLKENPEKNKLINIKFKIDRLAPTVPVVRSIKDGDILKGPVEIDIESNAYEVFVVCKNMITGEQIKSPQFYREEGVLYKGSYFIDVPGGDDKSFKISVAAFDKAGNFSHSDKILTFNVDNRSPHPPVISVINTGDNNKNGFNLKITSEEGTYVYYGVSTNGNSPEFINSTLYKEPVFIKTDGNYISNYLIKAWTIDRAGNISKSPAVKSISVGNLRISRIDPQIMYGNGSLVFISFPDRPDYNLFYKFGSGNFIRYNYPISIFAGKSDINFFYYTADSKGNRSPLGSKVIRGRAVNSNFISGVLNNGLYKDTVTVKKINNSVRIKYEAGVKGSYIPDVSYFSPEMPDKLKFTASDGETLSVELKVKAFDLRKNNPVSAEKGYTFTIDKTIPDPPVITGAKNNNFYQNGRSIRITSKEGKIFYKLSTGTINSGKFIEYSAPLRLDAAKGSFKNYNLEAYTLDRAGNKSSISSLHFSIDKAVVYLSSSGKDIYDGSRDRPFKTFQKALDFAMNSSRNTIHITEGEFTLKQGVILNKDINIIGGYDINNWEKGKEKTLITKEENGLESFPLFKVTSGKVTLDNIAMANFGLQSPLVVQNGGEITITNCDMILADNRGKSAVESSNGKLKLQNTSIIIGSINTGTIFSITKSDFIVNNLKITAEKSHENLSFFKLKDVTFSVIDNLDLKLKHGQVTKAFNLQNSSLNIDNSKLDLGENKRSAAFFSLDKSYINVGNSAFTCNSKSRVSLFMDAVDSKINFDSTMIDIGGNVGLSVFNLENSKLFVDNTDFTQRNASEFIYSIRFSTSSVKITNSLFKTGKTSDLKFIEADDSSLLFQNNTLDLSENGEKNSIFDLKDMSTIKIIKNEVIKRPSRFRQKPVIQISGDNRVLIADNGFKGISSLLNFNGITITAPEDLNSYRGLVPAPYGNTLK